ncbi:oligosaccharide flippase family protein [bacterium]|nr:oligosaccharide flippase family protein [bacterium]
MLNETGSAANVLGRRVVGSATVLGGARLCQRAFDIIRILTIARWLGPKEMGVFAIATLAITTLEQISETGLRQAMIQYRGDISVHITPVRTVQGIRGLLLGGAFYLVAPWISTFFNSPNSLEILQVMSILPIIRGMEPLYITIAQKNLSFKPVVVLQVTAAVISLIVGIVMAYIHPDAWALVWSSLSGAVITTVGASLLSRRMDLRYSLYWKPLKELHIFGFWVFVSCISSYAFVRTGEWLIGRMLDVKELALYQMAFLICTTATQEMGGVISQLSFPMFSQLQEDKKRLNSSFRFAFGFVSLVTFAMAGLICSCSKDLFSLVLGEKWMPSLVFVPWLTVWGLCAMFSGTLNGLFYALNRPKLWTKTIGLMTILLFVGIYPMVSWKGAKGVAILMAAIGILAQLVRYQIVARLLSLRFKQVLRHLVVPGIACIGSVGFTTWSHSFLQIDNQLAGLIFSMLVLLGTYILLVIIGRPWIDPSFGEIANILKQMFSRSNVKTTMITTEEIA